MSEMEQKGAVSVARSLVGFIEDRALPGTGLDAAAFWAGFSDVFERLAPENAALLAKRDRLQQQIDAWHAANPARPIDQAAYQAFLRSIGYLVEEPAPFRVSPTKVDSEVATMAGPQLVVPVLNARFVLNAANARWGSLYDALYGTDALPGTAGGKGYDPERGAQVIAWAKAFLDRTVPLADGSWANFQAGDPTLADPAQFVGRNGESILLRHNGLHIEVVVDRDHPIGCDDPAESPMSSSKRH